MHYVILYEIIGQGEVYLIKRRYTIVRSIQSYILVRYKGDLRPHTIGRAKNLYK